MPANQQTNTTSNGKPRPITPQQLAAYADAYRQMVTHARHRPPNSQQPKSLEQEAIDYAYAFYTEEESIPQGFFLGTSNYSTCRAFIFTVEAARLLAAGSLGEASALKLLAMAAAEVQRVRQP